LPFYPNAAQWQVNVQKKFRALDENTEFKQAKNHTKSNIASRICAMHERQYTGLVPIGTNGTTVIVPHCAHFT
jgi:hypothetical protein